MKKLVFWMVILSLLLLFTACSTGKESNNPTEFRVACFGCKQEFPSGQLNADFGLCQDCMMKVGAAYCQNCAAPCYTRDMIQGLCQSCSDSRNETTALQESTSVPEMVTCEYCGYSVRSDCMIGDYCVGCYSVRQGKCLRCTHNSRLSDGCHCAYCSENWFYCANCDKRTAGNDMFLDLCMDCYWRINSVFVPCPLCGASYTPQEMKDGYCPTCYPQASYDESNEYECTCCGREYDPADGHYGGLCRSCYCEINGLCISCAARPSDGMGPSGMECSKCYYKDNATCAVCGYDFFKDDMYGEYCSTCAMNPVHGTYYAYYENVKIVITYVGYEYRLSYTDLTSGITLSGIRPSYYDTNTGADMMLVFDVSEKYPEHSGYVELYVSIGARADYHYNARIDGLADTGGEYSPLNRE